MNVLITGSNGFIGKNLKIRLEKLKRFNIIEFNREHSEKDLLIAVKKAEIIVHLAGENRPENKEAFEEINHKLTKKICKFCGEKKTRGTRPMLKKIVRTALLRQTHEEQMRLREAH